MKISASNVLYSEHKDCLYISGLRDRTFSFVVSGWDKGLQVKVRQDEDWAISTPPELVLISSGKKNLIGKDITEFIASVPSSIQDIAARYQYQQIPVMRLLKYPGAQELAIHSPLIFWLLAEKDSNLDAEENKILVELLWAKRESILNYLGYNDSKSTCKLLAKVDVPSLDRDTLLGIKKILTDLSILNDLRHFQKITPVHLETVLLCPALLKYSFFKNSLAAGVFLRRSVPDMYHIYKDTVRLARILRRRGFSQSIRAFKTSNQLKRYHDRLADEVNSLEFPGLVRSLEVKYGRYLPEPIIPPNKDIVPITTFFELVKEARDMKNCLVSYTDKIMKRKSVIYKILKPERGTIELEVSQDLPRIAQIRLFRNGDPSFKTKEAVEQWLSVALDTLKKQN